MSAFRMSLKLLDLKKASVASVAIDGKPMNCVVIPCAYNDISITKNEDGTINNAYLNMSCWPYPQKYIDTCMQSNRDKENYTPPSHEVQVNYSKDFREKAVAAAKMRILKEAAAKGETIEEDQLVLQAKNAIREASRVGQLTEIRPKEAAPFTGQAPSAGPVSAYVPEEVSPLDDLPF